MREKRVDYTAHARCIIIRSNSNQNLAFFSHGENHMWIRIFLKGIKCAFDNYPNLIAFLLRWKICVLLEYNILLIFMLLPLNKHHNWKYVIANQFKLNLKFKTMLWSTFTIVEHSIWHTQNFLLFIISYINCKRYFLDFF